MYSRFDARKLCILMILVGGMVLLVNPQARADDFDRDGRLGLGADYGGPAITYWFSNRLALDAQVNLTVADLENDEHKNYGGQLSTRFVLKQKASLRFEGLVSAGFDGYKDEYVTANGPTTETIYRSETTSLGLGLGAEYSFAELPDLSFGAFVTGLTVRYLETERVYKVDGVVQPDGGEFQSGLGYSTSLRSSFGIRYYF